ncbi:MAG TPA: hypothetical protein VK701_01750 [Solirubrobacteraceae bacterium]|jgi:hypothetical protein|nr:hypothetical protein [Solirubrobacteraceae bacterium]
MATTRLHTVIDVLDNALDGDLTSERVHQLSLAEIHDLYESVNDFYDAWDPAPPPDGALRTHLGGWVARCPDHGAARDLLNSALLYAHEVVVYDPLAAYFQPGRSRLRPLPAVRGIGIDIQASSVHLEATAGYERFADELDAHHTNLSAAVRQVAQLAPLIRSGAVLLVPHLRLVLARQDAIHTAVRHMIKDDEYRALLASPIDRPPLTQDDGTRVSFSVAAPRTRSDQLMQEAGDAAYYLARTLAVAGAAGASYLPPSGTEWALYEQRLRVLGQTLRRETRRDLYVAPALSSSDLPLLHALDPSTLVAARAQEEAFEDWRTALRRATQHIRTLPSDGEEFVSEARDVLADELGPVSKEVAQATRRSKVLADSAKDSWLRIACGAATTGSVAVAAGSSMLPVAGATAGGMLSWLATSLFGRQQTGHRAVVAHLVHARSGNPDAPDTVEEDWPIREDLVISPKR